MKKTFTLLLCVLILSGSCPALATGNIYRMEYVGRDMKGVKRWKAETVITRKEGEVYTLTEKGEGVYSSFGK